ncbi:MAG TPA: adenylate/guanylate cyclase domain-containing protein, partial [Mycobacterium sp.]|nr:adenylate/guanylate cyclase domain-containing protein [Mycobacterium sp.]
MTAATACRTCGTEPLEHARFCHGCGSPVEDAGIRAEYKQVTVLFADVVHSMDIAAAVGAERLREIMADLADRCAAVVQRYGGTVDKFTGDGVMAVFGAPVALEDHAVRACLAALGIQEEAKALAVAVADRDGIDLELRVGLNSGEVIAGEVGSGPFGYTAIGEQVGMAQRMESAAPPGGVMLSESTARVVEHASVLAEAEKVHIKGSDAPVLARRLLGVAPQHERTGSWQEALVGRELEVMTITGLLDRSMSGRGCVVCVAGPAGIGKTRLVGEAVQLAKKRNVEMFSAFCESHASDIAFRVVARLLRAAAGVIGLNAEEARAQVRVQVPDADPEDLMLFDDLLGIADPDVKPPRIDPDARRRRLTSMINAALLARIEPALFIIEDAHWIDEVSESMLADFFTVIPHTPSMVLITYRPEYEGAFTRIHGAHTIALAPLSDSESSALVAMLLGPDSSVGLLGEAIVVRAAGNPFFAQEMVRDLAERGVLRGRSGSYVCHTDVAEVSVPATLQAAIAARIDRLDAKAKRALGAAAVIGLRFDAELLARLGAEPVVDELVRAELIDQVRFTPHAEYAFRHPLIRTVAYESQLKSDRSQLHRRAATMIGHQDHNAALIAEHLEAAGDLRVAYGWHMRAGRWSTKRDIAAARASWERARKIADALPDDDPDRTAMRIAPRTKLCGSAWRGVQPNIADRFEELRELCTSVGDNTSLVIGMTAVVFEHMFYGRMREALRLASQQMVLLESIDDPTSIIGAATVPISSKYETGHMAEILRWSQTVIQWAEGDSAKRSPTIARSPLIALALVWRGIARWGLGRDGWRQDLDDAVAMAPATDPITHPSVVSWKYRDAISQGVLRVDDIAVRELEGALQIAEASGEDTSVGNLKCTLGRVLVERDTPAERQRGLELLAEVRDMCLQLRFFRTHLPVVELCAARERVRIGDREDAISAMRKGSDDLFRAGQLVHGIWGTAILVETLLERG